MNKTFCVTVAMIALMAAGVYGADDVQWVRVTVLLESAPGAPTRADANLVPGGVYSIAEVRRRGQRAVDDEISKRVRLLAEEIQEVETSMRLERLVPRQYYLGLRVGEEAVLPVIDLNPRLGIVLTPLRFTGERVVCKVRFLEPEGPPGAVTYTGEPITLTLKDADIRDVIKTFAAVTQREIVVDQGVSGRVTLDLRKVPWDQALDVVLRTNDLGVQADGDTLRVTPLDELSRRKRVRTEAAINLPRGGAGSATIASRGDEVNKTVVLVVESVARQPELAAERDGLLHPPPFAVVTAKAAGGTAPGEVVVFRGTATAAGDLEGVEVLDDPGGMAAASLRKALAMAKPWTVLDQQVRRIEAVVGYGLRPTEATPSLEPIHVAVAEHIGIEMDVKPAPPRVDGGSAGFYVVSVELRDLETGEIISAPRITFRKGEEATVRSNIPEADGGSSMVELKLLIAEDGSSMSYSWTVTRDGQVVSSHAAEFKL